MISTKSSLAPGAILLMGLPGTGKGTQAFKLTKHFSNFVHFDTGAEIYRRINDPAHSSDPAIQEQRKIYNEGFLNDPQWVADLVTERVRFYAGKGKGVVFSGSPRTLHEAKTIIPLLSEIYGKERIVILILSISEKTTRRRALNRLVCHNRKCRYPTTRKHIGEPCPQCGTKLIDDQDQESWKVTKLDARFKEFRERTLPTLEYLVGLGVAEIIDAERTREHIFAKILETVERRLNIINRGRNLTDPAL